MSELARGDLPREPRPPPLVRLKKTLGRIRRRFAIDVYDVFRRAVPGPHAPAPRRESPAGYVFAWGSAEDVRRCEPGHTELDEREREAGVARLALGHQVVIGSWQGVPVFTMWVNPRNLNVPGLLKRRLASGQWFIYKAFTSPEHRGKKLYETGMSFVLLEMERRGLRALVGYAHVKKGISRKGLAALSFERAGRAVQVNFPRYSRTFLSRALIANFPEAVRRSGALEARASGAGEPHSARS
jgi:hypothetical protein